MPTPGYAKRLAAMEMQDRAVIVTGGASGIGKATALLLAREGARVFVGDIDENGGRPSRRRLPARSSPSNFCRSI